MKEIYKMCDEAGISMEFAQEIEALFKSEVKQGLIETYRNAKYQIAREVWGEFDCHADAYCNCLHFDKWLDQQLEQEAEDKDMKDDLHEDLATGRG